MATTGSRLPAVSRLRLLAGRVWDWIRRRRLTTLTAILLTALGIIVALVDARSDTLGNWTPNIATALWSIAITIAIVDRIVERHQRNQARDRIEQALTKVRAGFHVFADFTLSDYGQMHTSRYERPPAPLRDLLSHFKDGLESADVWLDEPSVLVASETLSRWVEEQIQRHDPVLDHSFIAAGYRLIRLTRIERNQYLDRSETFDPDRRKRIALSAMVDTVLVFYDVYEPYAEQYLDDAAVALTEDAIEFEGMGRGAA